MYLFNNIITFSFPAETDFTRLEAELAELAFQDCPPGAMSSAGFVQPVPADDAPFAYRFNELVLLALQTETRIVPPRVVDERLSQRLRAIEQQEGRLPGARARKRIKEEVIASLMAQSFTVKQRTLAMLDLDRHLLLVNTTSRKSAEALVSHVRSAMGSFPAVHLSCQMPPSVHLTHWVRTGELPAGWSLGDSCLLKGAESASVALKNVDLRTDEVTGHLSSGMLVARLAIRSGDEYSVVLDDALALRKFTVLAEPEEMPEDDLFASVNANLFLMATYYRKLMADLDVTLKFNAAAA